MKLGVMIEGQEGIGWQEWRDIVRWTEELGFESLWRSDHFFSLGGPRERDALETMVSLTYAAEHSSRIRFGPLVCSMTFRHPAVLARMAAAIDQLSNGRFILGIGAGWNLPEHDAFGISLPDVRQRLDGLEEGARVIRALFDQEPASFEGKRYQLREAHLNPKPAQSPLPILIGGNGEKRTLRIVARLADEWNCIALSPEVYHGKVAALEAHCEKEKRDPASIQRSMMCSYLTSTNETELQRLIKEREERQRARGRPTDRGGMLIGTPRQIVEQICALEDEGVERIMMQHLTPPSREALQLVAEEIMPHV
ncbi:MAG: TIGR03560 family F420-dependent LLM class oxidoreductase [Dehalococcoidia bacterium]|nr:TIGR03560 family F420-dependent LLM class oxidoreductase [Dehalococcoidia bacterium]